MLGSALHRHQERKEAFAVPDTGIFLQGLAERQMLSLGLGRKLRRVGRQECEWGVLVLPVLGEVKVDTSHEIPSRMTAFEELLQGELALCQFGIEGRIHAAPEIGQDLRRQVFRTSHGRNGRGHRVQFAVRRNWHGRLTSLADPREGAQRRHVARPELLPKGQRWRECRADLVGAQDQQPMPGPAGERLLQSDAALDLQHQRVFGLRRPHQHQCTVRRENGCKHHHDR
jgi:hypothetical protein